MGREGSPLPNCSSCYAVNPFSLCCFLPSSLSFSMRQTAIDNILSVAEGIKEIMIYGRTILLSRFNARNALLSLVVVINMSY